MKALYFLFAAALTACEVAPTEVVAPKAVATSDNRIGQGLMTYSSQKRDSAKTAGTTLYFTSNSFTTATFKFRAREITANGISRYIGEFTTHKMRYEDSTLHTFPVSVHKKSTLRVTEYYVDSYGGPFRLLGEYEIERKD